MYSEHTATQKLDILWQPAGEGARILRVFGEHPVLTLPDSIDGHPVTEIGAYCFSRSEPSIRGEYFHWYSDKNLTESTHLSPLAGAEVEEITLPKNVTTLHNAAFYNCRKLRRLTVGNRITSIGSDEFTNCLRLRQLIFYTDGENVPGLSLLLERLPDNLEVTVQRDNAVISTLFFPEYYEWLDEISPAHIFSRSIQGEGFRMRKSFEQNRISYEKYDRCFENAWKTESKEALCRIALGRLQYPVSLSDAFRQQYEQALKENLPAILPAVIKDRDRELLLFLCQNYFSKEHFPDALSLATQAEWGEGSALLMEEQHRQQKNVSKTFSFNDDW